MQIVIQYVHFNYRLIQRKYTDTYVEIFILHFTWNNLILFFFIEKLKKVEVPTNQNLFGVVLLFSNRRTVYYPYKKIYGRKQRRERSGELQVSILHKSIMQETNVIKIIKDQGSEFIRRVR